MFRAVKDINLGEVVFKDEALIFKGDVKTTLETSGELNYTRNEWGTQSSYSSINSVFQSAQNLTPLFDFFSNIVLRCFEKNKMIEVFYEKAKLESGEPLHSFRVYL